MVDKSVQCKLGFHAKSDAASSALSLSEEKEKLELRKISTLNNIEVNFQRSDLINSCWLCSKESMPVLPTITVTEIHNARTRETFVDKSLQEDVPAQRKQFLTLADSQPSN